MKNLPVLLFLWLLLGWGQAAHSAGQQYEINHIAFNSTFLASEIAAAYKITRAENMAVINVSVQPEGVIGEGVPAQVSGQVVNILNQVKPLAFTEVREEKAIYYIATLRFDDGDILTFKLDVLIDGEDKPRQVEWQQKFWKQ